MAASIPTDMLRTRVKDAQVGCDGGDPWGTCLACKAEFYLKGRAVEMAAELLILRGNTGEAAHDWARYWL